MEDLEELLDLIEELKELSKEGWVIVVEGTKDARSLRDLGIEGEIVIFSGFLNTAEKIKDRKVILLTDYDHEGFDIDKGLLKALSSYGNFPNVEFKRRLFCRIKKEVTKVEELSNFIWRERNEL